MKNFKITFNIEMADDVAPATISRFVSQIETVAYGELGKIGEFNINTFIFSFAGGRVSYRVKNPWPPVAM